MPPDYPVDLPPRAGNIPNADFTGTATGRFVLAVDTSTVPGFQNLVCDQAGLGGCIDGTAVPAPGGVIRLTFVKTNLYGYTTIGTSIYHYGPARIVANGRFSNYSAESTGNVFEVAVNQDKFAQTVRFTTH